MIRASLITMQNSFYSLKQIPKSENLLKKSSFGKVLILVIVLALFVSQIHAGSIKTPEPWQAQAGAATFTLTSVDTFNTIGDLKFGSSFTANLRILQLVPQQFQIVLGYRKIDALFSPQGSIMPSTLISAPLVGDSATSPSFNLMLYIEDQRLLTEVKANYLLIGTELLSTLIVKSFFIEIKSPDAACDALTGAQTCTYNKAVLIPSLTYKVYLSISGFDLESKSTSAATSPPSQTATATKLDNKLKSFTLTNLQIEFKIDKAKFTACSLYAIIIHPDMLNQAIIKKSMFIELVGHLTSTVPYQKAFSEQVLPTNYFVGLLSFKGFRWSFDVSESTPNDLFLSVILTSGATLFDFFAFVMYGYTQTCEKYRYCVACYTAPNFDCTQCQQNFVLTPPFNANTTCQCPSPFTLVSGVCDNHQFGCNVVIRLPDNSLQCQQCDFNKNLVINNTTRLCECEPYFAMDSSLVCKEICGDGVIVNAKCDDGNGFSGDGCDNQCFLEPGFDCDLTVQPTRCKSQSMLYYKIDKITKQLTSNSAIITLKLAGLAKYPLPVLKQQFNPISTLINFKIILSFSPYTEILVTDHDIVEIDQSYSLSISFNFNQTIQGTSGKIILNYQNTLYFNYTQSLDFQMTGDNAGLIYQSQIETYKSISYGMLAGTIICSILLFIGFVSPKFIGLEGILTLQLIFFSQTLIYDHMKFPVGFLFLSTLQYSAGYNDIFDFTQYYSSTENAKKMLYIKRHKAIIENFNINFIILLFTFIALLVVFWIRTKQEKLAALQKLQKNPSIQEKSSSKKNSKDNSNPSLRKINDIIFYINNQVAFWLFLPLISSIAAQAIIQNSTLIDTTEDAFLEENVGELISIPAFFMIYGIILSNFGNIWQSSESMSNAYERSEEIYYKRWLFIYLTIVGFMVLFMNGLYVIKIYTSAIVLIIHIIHMIVIFYINPYRQSLKIHTIGMLLNNAIYLVFLIIVNFINYLDQMNPNIAMFFGYAMGVFYTITIIITIIRLYYELRYGRELELQLEEERLLREQEENLRKEELLKSKVAQMQNQARDKISEKQRLRQKNVYLHENQLKEDQKKGFVEWLDTKQLQKKTKQAIYFQKFAEKPLEWLKKNDPQKYELKINEINQHLHNDKLRAAQKIQDQQYIALTTQLRKQVKSIKKVQEERVRQHEKGLKNSMNYAMHMYKGSQQKYVHQAYEIKP